MRGTIAQFTFGWHSSCAIYSINEIFNSIQHPLVGIPNESNLFLLQLLQPYDLFLSSKTIPIIRMGVGGSHPVQVGMS